ncbi:protein kinase [Streptomyces sp. NPDC007205]|uniref:protein kinase domain-containing protein n=1 Tax=Streptomyces sp. NPDC007205 TaxID=3154316 RepID=UPI0033D10D12
MCLGSRENPDQYILDKYIARGGEGESWRARRIDRSGEVSDWMVKVLPPQSDPTELRKWQGRWEDCAANAINLAIEGLVAPIAIVGPSPHWPGTESGTYSSYLVTPWCDGCNLRQWAERNPDPLEVADVLVRLCALVDRLHDRGWIHGDISSGNVMITRSHRVQLIDLAFLHRAGVPRTAPVYTKGYVALEKVPDLHLTTIEAERYAVGVLAREALLGVAPEAVPGGARSQFEEELTHAGYSAETATHAALPLADDPAQRPSKLLPWAERLRALLRDGGRPARHQCVDILAGSTRGLIVAAGGAGGVEFLRVPGPAPLTEALPPDEGAPRGVHKVAIQYTGTGRPVVFALDRAGDLHVGDASGWRTGLVGAAGLAVCCTPEGNLIGWTAHDGALYAVRCPADGGEPVRQRVEQTPAERVLAAARDTDGNTAVLVDDGSAVSCLRLGQGQPHPPPDRELVHGRRADQAALAVNRWGNLEAVLNFPSGPPERVEHDGMGWDTPVTLATTQPVYDVTAVGHRGGPTVALAGPEGVLVMTGDAEDSAWRLIKESSDATQVTVAEGAGWRLCLAAVVDGTARLWFEKVTGNGWDDRVVLM